MSECIRWTGSYDTKGYGRIKRGGKSFKAHRLAYERAKGPIPEGLFICHSCGNPACVNPEHLYAGTQKQNMADRDRHGSTRIGEMHANSKLTADSVKAIRAAHAAGIEFEELGRRYGISANQARNVALRKQWRHVP